MFYAIRYILFNCLRLMLINPPILVLNYGCRPRFISSNYSCGKFAKNNRRRLPISLLEVSFRHKLRDVQMRAVDNKLRLHASRSLFVPILFRVVGHCSHEETTTYSSQGGGWFLLCRSHGIVELIVYSIASSHN